MIIEKGTGQAQDVVVARDTCFPDAKKIEISWIDNFNARRVADASYQLKSSWGASDPRSFLKIGLDIVGGFRVDEYEGEKGEYDLFLGTRMDRKSLDIMKGIISPLLPDKPKNAGRFDSFAESLKVAWPICSRDSNGVVKIETQESELFVSDVGFDLFPDEESSLRVVSEMEPLGPATSYEFDRDLSEIMPLEDLEGMFIVTLGVKVIERDVSERFAQMVKERLATEQGIRKYVDFYMKIREKMAVMV